jgi:hypothetical protein
MNYKFTINCLRLIVSGKNSANMLVGDSGGNVFMIHILKDLVKHKINVNLNMIIENIGFAVNSLEISVKEPLDVWLVAA